jgi:demethylmenaquinone methyltransferase/2-methoxy-6-polyprenyl-1,4-benzoquinol methylase
MRETDFGFARIPLKDKAAKVSALFSGVAGKYDLMNDAMSLGLHRVWKRRFVADLPLGRNARVVDVAGGTGDVAAEVLRRRRDANVAVADLCPDMLERGRRKLRETFPPGSVPVPPAFHVANAESLPYKDRSFDLYTIAFGIRNVADKEAALKEARRVLKAGGAFACLEFSKADNAALAAFYRAYSFRCIPFMGKMLANDRDAYRYLVESIALFPDAERFADMLREAGFTQVSHRRMSGGIVAAHTAYRA